MNTRFESAAKVADYEEPRDGKWNYYSDNDPKICAWVKELISAKLVPDGDVDCRSIEEIKPDEIKNFAQHHFFCGILGWPLALRLAGWPADRPVWTASLPCQSFSKAGQRRGFKDARGQLWFPFFELVRQCRPECIFGEQVAEAIRFGWLDRVQTDLEKEGYACGAVVLGAHSVSAPHIRPRLFWVAVSSSARRSGRQDAGASVGHESQGPRSIEPERNGDVGRLVLANGARREQGQPSAETSGHGGAAEPASGSGGLAESGRAGDERGMRPAEAHEASGAAQGKARERERRRTDFGGGGESGGLADNSSTRLEEPHIESARQERASAERDGANFWNDFDIIPCADGKARRVPKSGFQLGLDDGLSADLDAGWRQSDGSIHPLAKGVKNRVALLRGTGNSIVPHLAAEFIRAFMETEQ